MGKVLVNPVKKRVGAHVRGVMERMKRLGHMPTPAITSQPKPYNAEPLIIEGFGAVPANDNVPGPTDKLRRLFRDELTEEEEQELDDALFGPVPVAAQPAQENTPNEVRARLGLPTIGQPRHGDFMQTATGRKFWPLDPKPDEVFIEDIAHSLSLQCRYAGHCLRFYSVAEHSVLMARKLRWEGVDVALWALLHDASEAYLVDVPRPVKPFLAGYKAAEAKVMAAICDRYSLAREMPAVVHDADNRIIADELVNLVPMEWHGRHDSPLGVRLRYWTPEEAEIEFLATFEALMAGRERGMA